MRLPLGTHFVKVSEILLAAMMEKETTAKKDRLMEDRGSAL